MMTCEDLLESIVKLYNCTTFCRLMCRLKSFWACIFHTGLACSERAWFGLDNLGLGLDLSFFRQSSALASVLTVLTAELSTAHFGKALTWVLTIPDLVLGHGLHDTRGINLTQKVGGIPSSPPSPTLSPAPYPPLSSPTLPSHLFPFSTPPNAARESGGLL